MSFVVNNVNLECLAVAQSGFPVTGLPEFAFVGRSNVGKSSLINAMVGRKAIARISQNPGKTRTINFYNVEETLYFVDLPGYGYAKVSKSESEKWGKMIEGYLIERAPLKSIVLLIDSRHEPMKSDLQMLEWLTYYGYNIIIAATKTDKLTKNQLNKQLAVMRKSLKLTEKTPLIPFSSETKAGKEELWECLEAYL